jgi:fatty-acyl-CoA synthase
LAFIERHRCTVYYGVAPITRALASCPDLARRDISALRIGTGNATPDDLRLAIEVLGVTRICNAYGLTEGHGHSTITDHTDPPEVRIHTQGTALPTQELRIVADSEPVGPDVPGEIQIRGLITPGYLDDDGSTAQGFTDGEGGTVTEDMAGGGWFRTGDLGKLDAHGRLTYLGRSHELMKINGINVSPLEVERVLVEHEYVDDAFVFGLPTPEGDETVAGVLVPAANAPDDLAGDVLTWLRARIAGYKVPGTIRVMVADQLPLTATGKVSKRVMRDIVLQ